MSEARRDEWFDEQRVMHQEQKNLLDGLSQQVSELQDSRRLLERVMLLNSADNG